MRPAEAVLVVFVTLGLVVVRPWRLNEGLSALLGAALVLVLGLVSPPRVIRLEFSYWNVFLFFLGMMAVAALADQSSVFDRIAYGAARLAAGSIFLLYLAIFLLGTMLSLFFANDSTALVLTPIVYALVMRLGLDPLPFVFAITFIADTASIALPVSNPLNVILVDRFHLALGSYLSHLWLPALLVILINIAIFSLLFRRDIRGRFPAMPRPEPAPGLLSTTLILVALAGAYLLAAASQFPLGIVALVGAATLALNLQRLHILDAPRSSREISWPIFAFIAGMLVVVQGLHATGVTAALGRGLVRFADGSSLATIAVATVGTALGTNIINNLPMALVMASTIPAAQVSASSRFDMIYATILGADLGPNLTHLGSLATFLWLFFLRRKGLDVSALDYFRLGVIVTPIMLVGAIFGLWLTSGHLSPP